MLQPRQTFDARRHVVDPRRHSRDSLIAWARHNAPDLRLAYGIVDGQRRCFAHWTMGGLAYEREAGDEVTLAREVVVAIARLMKLPVHVDRDETRKLERELIAATRTGNVAAADQIGHELAMHNEGLVPTIVRNRFRV